MKVEVFDVEHGQCSLVSASTGCHALIDCGTNSSTGWTPTKMLTDRSIFYLERLFLTNFDSDHTSNLNELKSSINIGRFVRNMSVTPNNFYEIKSDGVNAGLLAAKEMAGTFVHAAPDDDFDGIEFRTFDLPYPVFDSANNLSTVVFVKHPNFTMCFPGDLENAAWKEHIKNPAFLSEMSRVNIFMASHHGRANGCSPELFEAISWRPDIVIISDKGKEHATQETVDWYRSRATGIPFDGAERRVLTTRSDGSISIEAVPSGYWVTTQCP